jgi:hypothetical protein
VETPEVLQVSARLLREQRQQGKKIRITKLSPPFTVNLVLASFRTSIYSRSPLPVL